MRNVKYVMGGSIGYFIAALFNAFLVVAKESSEEIEEALVNIFGHHWIGHGILVLVVFVIFTFIGALVSKETEFTERAANKALYLILIGTILSFLIILGFFLIH